MYNIKLFNKKQFERHHPGVAKSLCPIKRTSARGLALKKFNSNRILSRCGVKTDPFSSLGTQVSGRNFSANINALQSRATMEIHAPKGKALEDFVYRLTGRHKACLIRGFLGFGKRAGTRPAIRGDSEF